ncbi:MAG: hypothetical protein ACI8VC_002204 [Candidatus Endobugula sp.]|jgi:hypothetical protein
MKPSPHSQQATSLLAQWQETFSLALFDQLTPELQEGFQEISDTACTQRFAIYQNNVFYSLTTALGDLYPVVKNLVGDDFFTGTAGVYFRQHPPQKAAMVFLGENFADFLRTFEHTQKMSYLADIAELELARHRAYHAADKDPLAAEVIAHIAPELLASSSVELHPSLHYLSSSDPIFSIWQNNQEDIHNEQDESPKESPQEGQKKTITLGEPQQVLVVRPMYTVCMYHIDKSLYDFIRHLHQRVTIEIAIENTLKDHLEFDVGQSIQFILQAQLITHLNQDRR